ncbi:MAG: Rrf2 family transcriptional regulator [Flavobacteriales bacterium]|nr:Rrf2 family transcriptional regulator [Flavobacteriales bacterium]
MLSKKAKYSLNALTYLARHYGEGPVLITDISTEENIPRKFLEAILLELKRNGILGSKMGKGGGYYLIKSPAQVNLADVIRIFDGAIGLLPCVTHRYYQPCDECHDEEACGIRSVLKEVRDVTVNALKERTLEQILIEEKKGKKKKKKSP